jgi:predicted transport protein
MPCSRSVGQLLALGLLTALRQLRLVLAAGSSPKLLSPTAAETVGQFLVQAPEQLKNLYADLDARLVALGDDVQKTERQVLLVYVRVDPDTVELVEGFSRDVRNIGHFGTGDLELGIRDAEDLARAEPLFLRSYEGELRAVPEAVSRRESAEVFPLSTWNCRQAAS